MNNARVCLFDSKVSIIASPMLHLGKWSTYFNDMKTLDGYNNNDEMIDISSHNTLFMTVKIYNICFMVNELGNTILLKNLRLEIKKLQELNLNRAA